MHGKRSPISSCVTGPQWAAIRRSGPSSSKMVTSSASHKRAALLTTTSSTGWSSVGEALMILRTSAVALCCSSASSRSRVRRASSVSWPTDSGALRRFGVTALWRCDLAGFAACSGAPSHRLPQGSGQGIVAGQVSALKVAGSGSPNVRFGSKADIASGPRHVRFTPKSGH